MSACLSFTRRVFSAHLAQKGHDFNTLSALNITSAAPGKITATYKVGSLALNRANTLHGGLISTLTDTMGSLALSSHGMHSSGVSTDIGTTFVRAAKDGETISISAQVQSMGKTLGFTKMDMTSEDGKVIAFGHHTKFIGRCRNPELDVEFTPEGEIKPSSAS